MPVNKAAVNLTAGVESEKRGNTGINGDMSVASEPPLVLSRRRRLEMNAWLSIVL